jgi:hypothetical protein
MSIQLPKSSFIALSAVAWADGRMSRDEAAGLLRAAEKCGLEGEELAEVERATKASVSLDAFDPDDLDGWQKGLTYALASWLARIDGITSTEEHQSLAALGERLGLSKDKLGAAASAAFDVSTDKGGHRPEKYDFEKLIEKLAVKLPSLAK